MSRGDTLPADLYIDAAATASGRPWHLRRCDDQAALSLSQRLGLPEFLGRVLAMRGIQSVDAAESFLKPRLRDGLPDPSHLLDLDIAVSRLAQAITAQEGVGIIGDYDVDGATSSALVANYLRLFGINVSVEIPDRFTDGYGPNPTLFQRLADAGCSLVLTLDCGTTAHAAIQAAGAMGIEVIVIDHHIAEDALPAALAIVNPNRPDQDSPLTGLAAVGVAFIFLIGLTRELRAKGFFTTRPEPDLLKFLDVVALGTVCDVVPLTGLNRSFVAQGLKVMANGGNAGIHALAQISGIKSIKSAMQLGFSLGPKINAGGRLGFSALGYNLLVADDPSKSVEFAQKLHTLNLERQKVERQQLSDAKAMIASSSLAEDAVIVVAGHGWNKGVVGINASRLADQFDRPAIVFAIDDDGTATGSARSRHGFDIGAATLAAKEAGLLTAGGGHMMAAGMSLAASKLDALRDFMCTRKRDSRDLITTTPFAIDTEFSPAAINHNLAGIIQQLEPYGEGNKEPILAVRSVRVISARVLKNRHLALRLAGDDGGMVEAIAFACVGSKLGDLLQSDQTLHLAGKIRSDEYLGRVQLKFQIEDAATD